MPKHNVKSRTLGGIIAFAILVLHVGCSSQATPQHEIAITSTSDTARAYFEEGLRLQQNQRQDEARAQFSKAIEADPEFAQAHLYRAFSAVSAEDFQKHLAKAVMHAPNVSEGERLMIEAVQANTENNQVKGLEILERLVERFPNDKRAHQFLGGNYSDLNRDDMAIAQYQKAIAIDKNFAPAYNSMGYAYIQKEDYANAERAFKDYIRLIPDEANPHDSIADLYTRMGRHEDAIEHFKTSIELNPKFVISQRKIGTNLVFMGKYDEGREAFQKAMDMEMTPTAKVTDMNQVALSHVYGGNPEQAAAAFDASIKMAQAADLPERVAGIHFQKCSLQLESGKVAKAEESLAACKAAVRNSDLRQSIKDNFAKGALAQEALIAARKGNFKTAMAKADDHLAKIQLDNNPTEIEDHQGLLGLIHFEKGDYAKAMEHLRQGDQSDPYILYYLALTESEVGDSERAKTLFKKVANSNRNGLGYALVRSKALAAQHLAEKY